MDTSTLTPLILEAWGLGLTGDSVVNYVCARSGFCSSLTRAEIERTVRNLIKEMSE